MKTNTHTVPPAAIHPSIHLSNNPPPPPSAPAPVNPFIHQSTDPSSAAPAAPRRSRRNGKIARLPKKLRDFINESLSDGLTYPEIIQRLSAFSDPPLPYPVSEKNLSNWHDGGYQDWLQDQERLDFLASRLDFALDLAQSNQAKKIHDLTLSLAAIRISEFFSTLAIDDPHIDPAFYLRLLSALPRISREALNLQKYRDDRTAREHLQEALRVACAPFSEITKTAPLPSGPTPGRPQSASGGSPIPGPQPRASASPLSPVSDTNGHLLKPNLRPPDPNAPDRSAVLPAFTPPGSTPNLALAISTSGSKQEQGGNSSKPAWSEA